MTHDALEILADAVQPDVLRNNHAYAAGGDDPILMAIEKNDWERLRKLSLAKGGFGERRKQVWPFLLHSTPSSLLEVSLLPAAPSEHESSLRRRHGADPSSPTISDASVSSVLDTSMHPDERQIKLDTDRSFVIYPVEGLKRREELQTGLNHLINSVFRRRPKLNYYQGYHDIITVLFLTLSDEEQLSCAEQLSLHRLRDSMGKGLEPLIGLLRIMKYLLRLADPSFAELVEKTSPLPYFALANILTLFSHDVPTLSQIQHVFDFLLCRPPVAAVYLSVAFMLTRKAEAERLEREGEDGMLHSLLSSLPDLVEEDEDDDDEKDILITADFNVGAKQNEEDNITIPGPIVADPAAITLLEDDERKSDVSLELSETTKSSSDHLDHTLSASSTDSHDDPKGLSIIGSTPPIDETDPKADDAEKSTSSISSQRSNSTPSLPPKALEYPRPLNDLLDQESKSIQETVQFPSALPAPHSTISHSHSRSRSRSSSISSTTHLRRPRVSLSSILTHADHLYSLYPPTHPSLAISSIMGPQSVIFTWNEDLSKMEGDDEAEGMVESPEKVVLPYEPESDVEEQDDEEEYEHEKDETEESEDEKMSATGRRGRRRRKLTKRRSRPTDKRSRGPFRSVDRKTVIAGMVIVAGIAMAVYTANSSGATRHAYGRNGDIEWKKFGKLIGGVFIGASERIFAVGGW